MAIFNISVTIGPNTRTITKTISSADMQRFITAIRSYYMSADSDNAAIDLFLNEVVAKAKEITLYQERKSASVTVDSVLSITIN